MKFLATCNPGLEDISIKEVEELAGRKAKVHHKGAIEFEGKEDDIYKLNYLSRSLHRVILLLEEGSFEKLEDIYSETKKIDFSSLIYPTQSFAIRPERIGRHNFTSVDIGKVAGQAVIDSYKDSKGVRLKVDLDNPHVIIRVEVRENNFWIGIDTTGEDSLHKRWYRKFSSVAPLKSTIVYCMLRLAEIEKNESLIDPMCGCGTIPIEAFLYLNNIPPNQQRNFAFTRLFFLDKQKFVELIRKCRSQEEKSELKVFGCDIKRSEVEKAMNNAKIAEAKINFSQCDATKCNLNYDKIVVDLPYGIRTKKKDLEKTYNGFFENLKENDWKMLVFITAKERENLIPKWNFEKTLDVNYGDLDARIFVINKKQLF